MRHLNNRNIIFLILLMALTYNTFATSSRFWDWFYFASRDLSISLLIFVNVNQINKIAIRGVAFFTSVFFFVSACIVFEPTSYFIALFSFLILVTYGYVGRVIFYNEINPDEYNNYDTFIVIRKPKRPFELIRAFVFFDSIGSIKIVKKGIQVGFKIKKHGVQAMQLSHTENPMYYIYIKTTKDICMKNSRYNILTNNCINCWNVNIKKEIKKHYEVI